MESLEHIFGPEGLLAEAHPGYEHRPRQIEMAEAVETALGERRALVCEAATGTGKTLAYLIPALRSDKRVVISTGTKALQEQLFHRDIPFLEEHWPEPFEAVLLKGRSNYLCKLRFDEILDGPRSVPRGHRDDWERIREWAHETETGDRAEIDGLSDDSKLWRELSVGSENCLHSECPFYEACHVTEARERADEADLIVVNHHLFFADLSLRDEGVGEILPPYDAVVFDEAHHLEGVATSFFGVHVSNYRFADLAGDVRRNADREDVQDADLDEAVRELERVNDNFFQVVSSGIGGGRHPIEEAIGGEYADDVRDERHEVTEALRGLRRALEGCDGLGEIGTRFQERCLELERALHLVCDRDDSRYAYFAEVRGPGTFLQAAPIDVAELFREKLLENHDAMVFTSATLATGGDLEFFKRRMGMSAPEPEGDPYPVDELILPPVFDYEQQAAIYVPKKLPPPGSDDFTRHAATVVDYLVDVTEGRAFVLFTSYANLHDVHDRLVDDLDYPVLKQGEQPKRELLEEFRAETESVLFATSSFWEGVDVEGEALSMVIIDKLPFANPSDPLVSARLDLLEEQGENAFSSYSLPSAALELKQGFGRLIRSRSDRGIVAILDSRIANRRYGSYFIESLPPAPVKWTAPAVAHWWKENSARK